MSGWRRPRRRGPGGAGRRRDASACGSRRPPRAHQPEGGKRDGEPGRRHHGLEDGRKAGPRHDQDEHQPDVVGLPHGSHRVVDEARGRAPRSLPPASRSQIPAPKSAPPPQAYAARSRSRTRATRSVAVMTRPRAAPAGPAGRGRSPPAVGTRQPGVLVPPADLHAQQDTEERPGDQRVDHDDGREGRPDRAGADVGDRIRHPHLLVDDPRLAADLGGDPARLEADDRGHAGERRESVEPAGPWHVSSSHPGNGEPEREAEQDRPDTDHRVEREVGDVGLADGRTVRPPAPPTARRRPCPG